MKLKKGDNVTVISGKDRGKSGKVARLFSAKGKAIVEGVNLRKKHVKPRRQGQKGQVVQAPAALDVSNLMLVCPHCNKKTRIGFQFKEQQDIKKSRLKIRICKKCQKEI